MVKNCSEIFWGNERSSEVRDDESYDFGCNGKTQKFRNPKRIDSCDQQRIAEDKKIKRQFQKSKKHLS